MEHEWPTKDSDLAYAQTIIQKYIEWNDGEPLGIFEVILSNTDYVDLRISDWILELAEHYHLQYGEEQGEFVTKMVVTTCLTHGETIH